MQATPLKIAMLSTHSCPVGNLGTKDTGGMSVYIRELARELGKLGHKVDVYTRAHDPKDHQIYELGHNARLIHLKAGENEEINKLTIYSYLPDFTRNLENFKKRNNLTYDLIFSHYWLSGIVGEHLQKQWDVPHITMFHTLGAVKNTIDVGEREPEIRIKMERNLSQNCQHIVAPTGIEKRNIISHYAASSDKITVIPCGVNLELFHPVDKQMVKQTLGFNDDSIILYVGRIEPLKGIDRLIRSISYLQNIQGLKLVIIGDDEKSQPEVKKLQKLCRELHVENSVNFLGVLKQKELPYYYSAADVCVIPSYYESFGLVALESLACGTPIIATNVGNMKSIIHHGKTGYVLTDNNPYSIADKIVELLSNSSDSPEIIREIRDSVSEYDWPNIAQKITGEFQIVLSDYFASVS
ncbi:MAG: glycosyltransferase [Dehalococcoidales bacterium]|nr:glycosyltransferase [Dehalococcoidales bacterium]